MTVTSEEFPKATEDLRLQDLMTVAEVARVLRVSKMTVYRMIKDVERKDRLRAVQLGRSYRVDRRDVQRLASTSYLDGM